MRHTLKNSLMTMGPIRAPQDTGNCVYTHSIPFECGRTYTVETGRLLTGSWHSWNLEVHLGRSRYAQHSFEENC